MSICPTSRLHHMPELCSTNCGAPMLRKQLVKTEKEEATEKNYFSAHWMKYNC